MLFYAVIYILKLMLFRIKNTAIHVSVALSLISGAFAFEMHFDSVKG